jgi:hypothetical protein
VLQFFEEMAGVQFIDAATGRPSLEILREAAARREVRKSGYELWLEEQDEDTKLAHRMGEV